MGATGEELKEGKGVQKLANLKRSCLDPALSPCPTRRRGGGGSLRAFRRARVCAAKGRGSWERSRWPDAKFEVTFAKCALSNGRSPSQSFARSLTHSLAREKRDERREKREDKIHPPRGRQRSPNEAARGPNQRDRPFSTPCCPPKRGRSTARIAAF